MPNSLDRERPGRSVRVAAGLLRVVVLLCAAWLTACGGGGGALTPASASRTTVTSDAAGAVVADGVTAATVTVTVRDAAGAPLPGRVVALEVAGDGNAVTQPAARTASDGATTGAVASTVAGVKHVTVVIDPGESELRLVNALTLEFTGDPGAISAARSTIEASPSEGVVADGATEVALTVTVRDVHGNPVPGRLVELSASGGGNLLTQDSFISDAAGRVTGRLSSTVAETKTVGAIVVPGAHQVVLSAGVEVGFVGDPSTIDPLLSTAVAFPSAALPADGVTLSTITVTARDAHGNPVAGQSVALAATGSGNALGQPAAVTDADGRASGTLASTEAGLKLVTATINPGAGEVVVAQTPTVEVVGDAEDLSAVLSSVVAAPAAEVVADGATHSTVTVTVRDSHGNPVPDVVVELAATGTGNTLTQPAGPTDASGVAVATLASTVAESKTLTATADPAGVAVVLSTTPTVTFVGDPSTVDAELSSVVASPTSLVADGVATATVTVTVRDAHGNPVPGRSVELAATGGGNTLGQPAGVTDAAGMATGTLASTVAGAKTLTATVEPGPGAVLLAATPVVTFGADGDAISASLSSVVASPSSGVVADGVASSTITVTVLDTNGNPVPGRVVQLAASGSGSSLTQPASVTDAAGVATGALRSTVAEVKTITATVDPGAGAVVLAQQPTVELVADASQVSAVLSGAFASPPQGVVADGVTTSAITVTLRDPHGNPIPGLAVQLAATGSANTLVQPAGLTDAAGTVSGSLASTRAEVKVITVTADPGGQAVVLLQTPTVELVGDPSTISATGSFASANPTTGVYANGLDHSTIDVVVRDANGNAVEGQTVFLSSTGTSNTFTQPAGPSDGNGSASGTLSSTTSELKTITVTVNPGPTPVELVQKPTVEFIADTTVSPSLSTVAVLPATNVVADGVETSTVTVTVRDGLNNLVPGAVVWIAASGTGNTIAQPVGPTNGAGQALGTIASVVAETKTVLVTVNPGPDAVLLDDLPTVAFIADADRIDDTLSSVVASPATGVAADGASLSTITVTVRDDHGNPVPDQAVSLAATGSGNALTQPAGLTDAAGVASGTIASSVAETKTITATVEPGPSQVVLATQPAIEFIPDAIDAGLSSVVAVPSTNVVADGTSLSTITVTVVDTLGNPVPGQTVQLATTGTGDTLTQPAAVTDAAGVAAGTLASTHAESKTITATVNPGAGQVVLDDHPSIEFIADASNISAALSGVVAVPSAGVVADGSTSSTLTITVRDAHGNPVPGRSVLLAATGSGGALTQPVGTTDATGTVTGALASTVAEVKTVTATVDPGPGEVVLAQQPTVEFVADPSTIDAALSSVVAWPSAGVVADGVDASTITVSVRDAEGNPVPGQTVQVACSGGGNTVTPPAGPTDAAGQVTATLRSTVAETKTVVVTVNPGASAVVLAQQPTVELVADADAVNAALSTVVATPSADVVADGATLSTITVTVVDTYGNPIPGKTVQLAATGTGNTLVQPAAVTDAAGATTGTLASTVAEDKVVTATVDPGPGAVVLAQTPAVGFVADPGAISDSRSSAVAAPSTGVVADGVTVSTITVTVRDVRGNPVPGRGVDLAATGAGNTLVQPASVTDAAGQASGTICSTVAEMKVVTATVDPGPGEVVLVQTPSIEFIGDLSSLSASLSQAFAVPSTGVTADGVATAAVYVYVRDANDNPVPGVTVTFAASGGGGTATQPAGGTDANGLATGSLASTVAELKTLSITADPAGSAVLLDREPTVLFVADPSTISTALSTAVASPDAGVVADGVATSTITVTVRDANGNPVAGRSVELAASGAGNTLTQPAAVTDASGVATGSLASTVAGEKTVTATIDPGPGEVVVTQQPAVEFVSAGVPSASVSTVTVDLAAGVAADGVEAVTITVTVRDELGNPLAGETVALAATGTGNVLAQPTAVTDASGVTTGTLASRTAERKTVTATVDPGGADVALDEAPTVEFAWSLGDTYYVRIGGVDPGGCGGGTSPATAWATLAQAAGCVSPGDTVYVGAGTYLGAVTLTTPGTAGAPIRFIADRTGAFTGDAGEVVVDGAVGTAALHLSGADWNELHGFTVIGASGAGPPCGGILVEGTSVLLRDNVVYGNVGGIYVSGVDSVVIESNRISSNLGAASSGIVLDGADGALVRNNLVYDSGLHGVSIRSGTVGALVEGNTLYGNAGDGVHCDVAGETVTLRDNLICDSGDDGIEQVAGTVVTTYNDVFGSGDLDYSGGVVAGPGDLSADPLFVDVDGADDQLGGAQGGDDDFRLDEVVPSAAVDSGSTDAASSALADGTTLAERTTREDDGLDGEGANGATVDLGYHYEVTGAALGVLESGDLRVACGGGTARRLFLRDHDLSAGGWSGAVLGPPTGGAVRWVVSEPSPLECEEELLAVLSEDAAATDLRLLRWTGDTWLTDWRSSSIALADAKRRGLDLAYEASGDALVVYSDGTSTPVYRTLVAGEWSEEASLPLNDGGGPYPDTNGGVVTWVELVPRPGADEVALLFSDDADDLVVIVWDGDLWTTAGAETLETSLSVNAASGEVENRVFDGAYEEATGDLLVAWGQHGTNGFWWRTQASGSSSWSVAARVAATPGGGPPHFLDLAAEPGSERIAAGSFKLGSTSEQLGLATWSGSGWVHATELDAQIRDSNGAQTGDLPGAVAWLGTTGQAVCVYSDDAGGALDWASWSASVGWELRADVPVAGKDVTESVQLVRRGNRSLLLALLSDAAGVLWAASYDGVDWSITPAAAVLSGISGTDTVPFAAGVRGD